MALGANGVAVPADNIQLAAQAVNAAQVWNQSFAVGGSRDLATAANQGRVQAAANPLLKGQIPLGFSTSQVLGNTTVSATNPTIPEATLDVGGRVHKNIPVTGLAGTVADNFRLVYLTDDNTFTLTRPSTLGQPVGFVSRFVSATNANVYFFRTDVLFALGMCGNGQDTVLLGIVSGNISVSADEVQNHLMSWHGRILSVWGDVVQPLTGAGASLTVQPKINGTLLTGGAITWVLADTAGSKKAGTAVTAGQVFSDGDNINVNVAVGTASTTGLMAVWAQVLMEPGL